VTDITAICHYIDRFIFRGEKLGGIMKARPGTKAFARRFSLIFVLLLATMGWTVSNSAAQQQAQPAQPGTEQTAAQPAQPPASPGPSQAAQPGQETAQTPQPEGASAQQPVEPAQPAPGQAEQPAQAPAPAATAQLPGPAAPQSHDAAAPQPETAGVSYPPEYIPLIQKATASLLTADFTFYPIKALDPFVPFLTPETSSHLGEDDEQKTAPLTPLQKMTLAEIERGLKAITWGDLGKKAVIEDSTGRGYIVAVGTPAGENSGVITQISNDHLVIQQEMWDRKAKKRFPQEYVIKLVKKTENLK
jgi:type IV pilus assembly protein PilP